MSTTKIPAEQVQESLTLIGRLFVQAQDARAESADQLYNAVQRQQAAEIELRDEQRVTAALRLDLDGALRELEELRKVYTARNSQCQCAEYDVKALQARNESLQDDFKALKARNSELHARVMQLEAERGTDAYTQQLRAERDAAHEENVRLKFTLRSIQIACEGEVK